MQWWKKVLKANVVGYDVECVQVFEAKVWNMRGGKVAIVGSNGLIVYKDDIYHRPGSFSTHPKAVAKSGIEKNDLEHGEPLEIVRKRLLESFKDKMVVVCGGANDFLSVEINPSTENFLTFDLQTFYTWIPDKEHYAKLMSLRDIHFLEIGFDFQGTVSHLAEVDAAATVKCFIEGYVVRNNDKMSRGNEFHNEVFEKNKVQDYDDFVQRYKNKTQQQFVRLADTDKKKIFYCKSKKMFVNFKVSKCFCNSCKILFANQ